MKKAKWQKKLTIAQIWHIKETTQSGTLAQFKRNRIGQIAEGIECFECKEIAKKLKIEK